MVIIARHIAWIVLQEVVSIKTEQAKIDTEDKFQILQP